MEFNADDDPQAERDAIELPVGLCARPGAESAGRVALPRRGGAAFAPASVGAGLPGAADEDTVRDVIHRFNEIRLACLDPQWAGGRPRLLSPDDEAFIAATATTRPSKLGQPFTRWSIRKSLHYLHRLPAAASRSAGKLGPRLYDWALATVHFEAEPGYQRWLLVRSSLAPNLDRDSFGACSLVDRGCLPSTACAR
jgi:Homeodomain-like domain